MDDLEPNDESIDTPIVSPFLDSNDDLDNGEVLKELEEYRNVGKLCQKSFIYVTDFVVLEDIGEFILRDMAEVVMGKPFREVTKLEYDYAKGLMSFTRILDNYTFQMPRTIPRLYLMRRILGVLRSFIGQLLDDDLTSRKAHLLEDKQIPSVRVFDEVTWIAFRGCTCDLGSFGEEIDKITTLHRSGFKNCSQSLKMAS
ncbi:hypothetical protein Tco_0533301 [Tanacetum coccineum]